MGKIHQSVWASERVSSEGEKEKRTSNSADCESEQETEEQSEILGRDGKN